MRSEIFTAAIMISCTIIGVRYLDRNRAPAPGADMAVVQSGSSTVAAARTQWGREVRIAAARDHQYYVNVAINRRSANFLIDTGASYVALRESDARDAGVYTSWTDFNYPVRTANGETKAALVTLDEMEIDDIRVEGVKAFILPDDQLSVNLLGMSFLSRIESVEARAGEMVLRG